MLKAAQFVTVQSLKTPVFVATLALLIGTAWIVLGFEPIGIPIREAGGHEALVELAVIGGLAGVALVMSATRRLEPMLRTMGPAERVAVDGAAMSLLAFTLQVGVGAMDTSRNIHSVWQTLTTSAALASVGAVAVQVPGPTRVGISIFVMAAWVLPALVSADSFNTDALRLLSPRVRGAEATNMPLDPSQYLLPSGLWLAAVLLRNQRMVQR